MKKEWKDKWVAALRSGEYEQGKGRLRRARIDDGKDQFCCLGVLCDLVAKEYPDEFKWNDTESYFLFKANIGFMSEIGTIPSTVIKHTGPLPIMPIDLIAMNDDMEFSFAMIADKIEEAAQWTQKSH